MYFENAIERIRDYIKTENIDGVLLGKRSSFSWFSGGESSMNFYTDIGLGFIWVTNNEAFVCCGNNEKDRIEKEIFDNKFPVKSFSWIEGPALNLAKLISDKKVHSDFACGNAIESFGKIKKLRYSLFPEQIKTAEYLSQESAAILENTLKDIKSGLTEKQIQAQIYYAFEKKCISLPVLLIAGDHNLDIYRHPLATDSVCNNRVMVVICSQYNGVVIAATRIRYFKNETDEEARKNLAVCKINAQMIEVSKKETHSSVLWQTMINAYKANGYEDEYLNHHQGGAIGFESREWILRPNSDETILSSQMLSWNPTIAGTKSEETCIIRDDGNPCILTITGKWPTVEYNGLKVTYPLV